MTNISPTQFVSRPRDDERTTRKRLGWWDRVKFLVLLAALFGFLVWTESTDNPILPLSEAFNNVVRHRTWIFVLAGLELVRQIHYLIAEHWSRYYFFWQRRFSKGNARIDKVNPWTRFRLARVFKWFLWLSVFNAFVAWRNDEGFITQFANLPTTVFDFLFGTAADLPMIFQLLFAGFFIIGQFALLFWFLSKGGTEVYYPDDVNTRFSDVWGQDGVLEKVKENIVFLEEPEAIEQRGGYVPAGILLFGPPGTGKTLMAEAVAGETGRPFVFVEPGAFQAMFMGIGILKVKSLFRKLRKLALRYGGVIVFFDEADALGNRGASTGAPAEVAHAKSGLCHGTAYLSAGTASMLEGLRFDAQSPGDPAPAGLVSRIVAGMGMGGGGDMGTLQALLAELSGMKKPRGFFNRSIRRLLGMRPKPPPRYRMLVMMASNRPDALDPALLRPGRIDRIYRVGYPSKAGRVRTYEGYLAKIQHELTPEQVEKLAVMTPYATGATIKDVVNEGLIIAIRDGRETVTWVDIVKAKHLKSLGPSRDVELVAQDRHGVAVHEACHAVVAYRARKHLEIDLATIDPGNEYLGMVASVRIDDRFKQFKSEFEADIMVSVASLAGERIFFDGDSASGVSGDLASATQIAILMEGFWGMGSGITSRAVTIAGGEVGDSAEPDSRMKGGDFGERIEKNLARLLRLTTAMLEKDRTTVLCLAHALEVHKTIAGDDVAAVIECTQGPIVDGTQYADPEFVRAIVAYHDEMLAAHRAAEPAIDISVPARVAVEPLALSASRETPVPGAAGA